MEGWTYIDEDVERDKDSIELRHAPDHTLVYEMSGPLFFGAADKILDIHTDNTVTALILRMRSVSAIDATAMHNLETLVNTCEKKGIQLILSHVNEQPMRVMRKAHLVEKVGEKYFCQHIDDALALAETLTGGNL